MNITDHREPLTARLKIINPIILREDEETDSVCLSFEYLKTTYTTYLNAQTETGRLLRHDPKNMTKTEYIGDITANDLICFFSELPSIEKIVK